MLSEVIGEVRTDPGIAAGGQDCRPKAPGMKYRHYAPDASMFLVEGPQERVIAKINDLTRAAVQEGKKSELLAQRKQPGIMSRGT